MRKIIGFFRDLNAVRKHRGVLGIMSGIVDLLKDAADEKKPMISHIGFVNVDTKENQVMVSLWAGIGDANPLLRIRYLKAQNEELKRLLNLAITSGISEEEKSHVEFVLNNFE